MDGRSHISDPVAAEEDGRNTPLIPRFISDSHGNTRNVFVDTNQPLADKVCATERKVAELDGKYAETTRTLGTTQVEMRREYLEIDATVKQMALTVERLEKGLNDALNAEENHRGTKDELVDTKNGIAELRTNVGSLEKMLGLRKFHHAAHANRGNPKSPVLQNIQAKTKEQDKKIALQNDKIAGLEKQMQMLLSLLAQTSIDESNPGFRALLEGMSKAEGNSGDHAAAKSAD